ncbi:MAG: endolytic transglycosylase MltG [Bradymonadaceae bacterium]
MATKKGKKKKGRGQGGVGRSILRAFLGLSLFVVLGGAASALALYLHYEAYLETPILSEGQERTIVIPPNTAWPRVVEILEEAHLVRRPLYFQYWSRETGLASQVKAGTFWFEGPLSLDDLAAALREGGRAAEVTVTFPEGFTIFHMADRLEGMGLMSREEFLRAARDGEALAEAGLDAESFEGYLFPDTYRFRQGMSGSAVVGRLHAQWQQVWEELLEANRESFDALAAQYEFGVHEVVTMASLVERETNSNAERDLVSRVFFNRLDRNMRLQTDPTCVYGEETYMLVPTPQHCRDPLNRYSTYVIDGLTPGPIANPGRESLEAALVPSTRPEALEYIFFVSRRDGTHHFTRTYQEHRQAIRRFLK